MLDSWSVNNNHSASKQIEFNPVMPYGGDRINQFSNTNVGREEYAKYGWLFGGR
jgi:hypothetical protein